MGHQKFGNLLMKPNQADLLFLKELCEAGKVKPLIDRRFLLSEVPAAVSYVEDGHARGKSSSRSALQRGNVSESRIARRYGALSLARTPGCSSAAALFPTATRSGNDARITIAPHALTGCRCRCAA
jgi:hypothetical protein